MKIGVKFSGSFKEMLRRQGRDMAVPITNAVAKAGLALREELRSQVRAAGLGARLPNTWRFDVYPKGRFAYEPVALVYSKAPNIVRAFNDGTLIKAAGGKFLAIPTPNAPARGKDGKRITPTNWPGTGKYGRLRLILKRRDLSLLVVDLPRRGVALTYAAGAKSRASRAKLRAGTTERDGQRYVVMFWLVDQSKMPHLLDIEAAAEWALDGLHADLRRLIQG